MKQETKTKAIKTGKSLDERRQDRLKEMYASQDTLPASISIRQAEDLMKRVQELETRLGSAPAADAPIAEAGAVYAPERKTSLPPTSPEKPARFPRLAAFWNRLTGAHPDITDAGERQQAQLAAAIAIGVALLTTIGTIAGLLINTARAVTFLLLGLTLLVGASYALIRTRRYKLGAALLTLLFAAAGFVLAYNEPGRESNSLYSMLPIALVMGSLLLPVWGMGILTGMTFLAVTALPVLIPAYTVRDASTDSGIFVTIGVLLIIAVLFRNAVERTRVAEVTTVNQELQAIQSSLEKRVEDRTHDLELASTVGRNITEKIANLNEMLTSAAELILARFDLYYTQVYLTDPAGKNLILRAGTGDVGQLLLARNHHLPVTSGSLNGRAALDRKAVIVEDTSTNPTFLPNPLLPRTRSEMAIPLQAGGQVIGVLDMQSELAGALNESNLPAFEALAGQLAVAIQNAALFAQTQEARQEIEASVRRTTESGWQDFLNSTDRSERIGVLFDQEKTIPVKELVQENPEKAMSIPITILGAEVGRIQTVSEDRQLTARDRELMEAASASLSQRLESLRLLAQAEGYRTEAEQAVRRLTREGWESYFKASKEAVSGYAYDQNDVIVLDRKDTGKLKSGLKQPLRVRDQAIGELAVDVKADNAETSEILDAVAGQLSSHIENLRLFDATQQELVERKRAEESLTKFRLGIQQSTDAMFITDLEGQIIYTNPAFEKIYGYTQEEALGKTPRILKSGVIPQERYKEFWKTLMSKEVVAGEIINKTKDGRLVPIEGANTPILDEDGNLLGFLAIHRDITERKLTQEALTKRATELETVAQVSATTSTELDPDQLLKTIVDLAKERFHLYHAHIYLADDASQTLRLAAGAGEVGRKMVKKGFAIPMGAEKSLVARSARLHEAVIANDVQSEPDFLPNKDLPETRSELAVPMIVADKVLGVFDVQSDRTDGFTSEDAAIYTTLASQVAIALQNARLYAEQGATVLQLRELDRLKNSFLANMSHELRTPLNSILGFSDVMLEELDGPLTPEMGNDLKLIQKNGQHLLHLINDVLDMAKIEAGRMNLTPEKIALVDVFNEVINITSPLASEKNLTLHLTAESDPDVEIVADRTRLSQVMINLVNNSIKFTEQGEITIQASRKAGDRILIAVHDTGIGIPPDKLETIFQEFAQVDTSTTRKAGGTGLGLPISRRLVEMHGGRLWADSTGVSGEGSTFYVEMPQEAVITETVEKQES